MIIIEIVTATGRGKEAFKNFYVANGTKRLPALNGKGLVISFQTMLDGGSAEIVTKGGKLALLGRKDCLEVSPGSGRIHLVCLYCISYRFFIH